MTWARFFTASVPALFFAATANSASFDCAQARAPIEKIICSDQDLNALDAEMSSLYFSSIETLDAEQKREALQAQRVWLRARNSSCGDLHHASDARDLPASVRACLITLYRTRVHDLSQAVEQGAGVMTIGPPPIATGAPAPLPPQSVAPSPSVGSAPEPAVSLQALENRARAGDTDAQIALGTRYYRGDGAPQNYAGAVKWFFSAAEQGVPAAQYALGVLYYHGFGVGQSMVEAEHWYRVAAKNGDASAQYSLGLLYAQGGDVPQDLGEARFWLLMAQVKGVAAATDVMRLLDQTDPSALTDRLAGMGGHDLP